jgi:ribosomal protein L37AE/L43A
VSSERLMTCPLCEGRMEKRPTEGAWECMICRALLFVGRQTVVQHYPHVEPPEGMPHGQDDSGK